MVAYVLTGEGMAVTMRDFGQNQFGEDVDIFTLTNANGIVVRIMDHGAAIVSVEVPDRNGNLADIVLGHDTPEEYTHETPYFGSVVGRYANRIRDGKFTLDGETYQLSVNNGPNSLHGGIHGFDKVVWDAEILPEQNAVRMHYHSKDGDENYPGNLDLILTYTLSKDNELKIDYVAETDKPTPINLTNHSFFNLSGHDAGDHSGHLLEINADHFTPVDESLAPHGTLEPVEGTPLDFTKPTPIGERIDYDHEQLKIGNGYDHNFCLNKATDDELSFAARAVDPESGRVLEVFTTEPGVQLYTGNFLDGTLKGKNGCMYQRRGAFCLETQHYPDSPNQPHFPNTILRPGEKYTSQTIYKFSVEK